MGIARKSEIHWNLYWYGQMSACYVNGAIETYLHQQSGTDLTVVLQDNDGILGTDSFTRALDETTHHTVPGTVPITATLCCQSLTPDQRSRILLTPLDDATFQYGLTHVLSQYHQPPWNERKPLAFWRGVGSGYETPLTRKRVLDVLYDHPNSDVRFAYWDGWNNSGFPAEYFVHRCGIEYHMQYKYILIVDGNCIASSLQWIFGSGSVPILVTHPENDYWFKPYVKPMVHYVPVDHDLGNLRSQIDWLVKHDDDARQIAENAKTLSDTIFTPEFQREYIRSELNRLSYTSSATTRPSSEQFPEANSESLEHQ